MSVSSPEVGTESFLSISLQCNLVHPRGWGAFVELHWTARPAPAMSNWKMPGGCSCARSELKEHLLTFVSPQETSPLVSILVRAFTNDLISGIRKRGNTCEPLGPQESQLVGLEAFSRGRKPPGTRLH